MVLNILYQKEAINLYNSKVKSLSIEINENFREQYEKVLNSMERYNFKVLHKKNNENLLPKGSKFTKTYNYTFIKQKQQTNFLKIVLLIKNMNKAINQNIAKYQ